MIVKREEIDGLLSVFSFDDEYEAGIFLQPGSGYWVNVTGGSYVNLLESRAECEDTGGVWDRFGLLSVWLCEVRGYLDPSRWSQGVAALRSLEARAR